MYSQMITSININSLFRQVILYFYYQTMKQQTSLRESLLSSTQPDSEGKPAHHKNKLPEHRTVGGQSCFQSLFFTWLNPLLSFGAKNKMEVEAMPELSEGMSTSSVFNRFSRAWQSRTASSTAGLTLMKTLFRVFLKEWLIVLVIVIFYDLLFVFGPIMTSLNIDYIQNHRDNKTYGLLLFGITVGTQFLNQLLVTQFYFKLSQLGVNLSNTVTMMIYDKSLKYAALADKEFSQAEIINYSQVDAQKLASMGYHLASFFYGPIQFVIGLILMYLYLGIAFLAGVGVMVVILIISYFLSKINARLNEQILQAKDERMKSTQEMLDIIRYIKITAIEKFFFKEVSNKRVKQVALYLKLGLNDIAIICLFWFTSPLLQSLTFLVYILLGNQINANVAFTSMMIAGLFQFPLYSLPTAVTQLIQIVTSIKRIEKFLLADEIKNNIKYLPPEATNLAVEIESGNFYWKREEKKKDESKKGENEENKKQVNQVQITDSFASEISLQESLDVEEDSFFSQKFSAKDKEGKRLYVHALKDISLKIKKGTFTMILGDIGSGKSSLLMAIINEMLSAQTSKVTISGSIAYSAQKPWIMSKTLKQNITFMTKEPDDDKFRNVLHYAALEDDLKLLPKGVETEIGEKGINLSGGQKARVSLARSLYSDRDILLLDDILSAVDVHVGQFIVKQTIKQMLKGKAVVMPTHAIKFASFADQIIIMKKGRIIRQGPYRDICSTAQFEQISIKEQTKEEKEGQVNEQEDEQKMQAEMTMIKQAMQFKKASEEMKKEQGEPVEVTNMELIEQLILPQDHETGSLNMTIIKEYIKENKGLPTLVMLGTIFMLVWVVAKTAASLIMELWCKEPAENGLYIYYFIGANMAAVLFVFMRSYVLLIATNNQSKLVHDKMVLGLLYADLSNFFNRVPTGRIVNRLTKDLRQLDQVIMEYLAYVLICASELLAALFICIYAGTPFAAIPMVIVGFLANAVRKYYLKTERQASRYEKSTNSPVVSGFMSSISGLSTIRAFKSQQAFTEEQVVCFDINKRVRMTKAGLQNWFSMRLSFLSFLINMPCIAYCMFLGDSNPATMGLLMVYALSISDSVVGLTICEASFEAKLVSIERIYKFMHIDPEKKYLFYCGSWMPEEEQVENVIEKGQIEFKALKVRYRQDLPDVLKGVSCLIKPGQKVGIVGRTGAGKTTIINTLLGITDISEGTILIDGTDINAIPMKPLRRSLTMIDQEPTLLKSTFRQNLDITQQYSDAELEPVLKQCNLWEVISQKGGLSAAVSNSSLSAGQKQLLCICRAFLKHSKIVLIDEATANIDIKNDSLIQKVIADKFKTSTVLTIAHRLSTLKNSDKIMVMEQGQLVEFGTPRELEEKQGGLYQEMLKKNVEDMLK